MAFNRRCEALLETGVRSTILDVAFNGVPYGLGRTDPVDCLCQVSGLNNSVRLALGPNL